MLFVFMAVHVYFRAQNKARASQADRQGRTCPTTVRALFVMYPTLFPAFQEFVSLTGPASVRMHPPVSPLCVRVLVRVRA